MDPSTTTRKLSLLVLLPLGLVAQSVLATIAFPPPSSAAAYTSTDYNAIKMTVKPTTLTTTADPKKASVDVAPVEDRYRLHPLPGRELYVVAHPDDDLLFMSPTVPRSLDDPDSEVHIVYVTSGSSSFTYAQDRESGIRAAYAVATGEPNAWTFTTRTFGGQPVQVGTLDGDSSLHVYFMRVRGGLLDLWRSDVTTRTVVGTSGFHTYSTLVDALEEIILDIAPDHVATLDPTEFAHGSDHVDHVGAARFALSARQRYTAPHSFAIHRGYNLVHAPLPANLSAREYDDKEWVFQNYAIHDDNFCENAQSPQQCTLHDWYPAHVGREYSESAIQDITGPVRGYGARCLAAQEKPELKKCVPEAADQIWTVAVDQTIRRGSLCLDVPGPYVNQRPVVLAACDGTTGQRFTLLSDGRILGPGARCLEVTPDGRALQLFDCLGRERQRFVVEAGTPRYRTSGGDFSDADLGSDPTKARSFSLGDLDGDGDADACVRRADGVWCARNYNGFFAAYTRWSPDFGDDQGWARNYYGPTLQLGDINGDGRADVCGRGRRGVHCAHANPGGGFGSLSMRTANGDFGDDQGYAQASRATSVGLVDVDGDGLLDVCGRDAVGIRCAANNGNGFFPSDRAWLVDDFGDSEGWGNAVYGSTITYGDIDGDGLGDVCGRGREAVFCARSNSEEFVDVSRWGYDSDFSNAQGWDDHISYYGSIRIADIDGDGRGDLCGRGRAGLWCAISQSTTGFDNMFRLQPHDYRDDQGWRQERFGPTIEWADLDGDGHADACGRAVDGLICSSSP